MTNVKLDRVRTLDRHMMATKAQHKLGDISRDKPDLCYVYAEDDENWIGQWETGLGLFDVHFPKSTTRELTPEEVSELEKQYIQVASHPPQKIVIRK